MLSILSVPFSLVRALFTVIATRHYREVLSVPVLIGIISFFGSFVLCWKYGVTLLPNLPSILPAWTPQFLTSSLDAVVTVFSNLLGAFAAIVISSIASILITMLIASAFLELFVERVLVDYGLLKSLPNQLSFIGNLLKGLWEDLKAILFLGCFSVALLFSGLIPILTPVVFIVGAYLIGFEIYELPHKLTGKNFKQRWRSGREHTAFVLSLGLLFSALLVIPFATMVFLPAGYLVVIDKTLKLEA